MLSFAAYWAGRMAWADYLSRSPDLARRERAVRWLATATLYERVADKREESGGDPLPHLEQAVALDPENAARRLRLGLRAEFAGDFERAERNLLEAAALSRLYLPCYSLAQYYFRRQNADSFWRWSNAAFHSAYGDVTPLLELCWRMRPDGAWLAQQARAERAEIARQYLMLLVRHRQTGPAFVLAAHITGSARSEDLPSLLAYCDLSLSEGGAQGSLAIWNGVCRKGLLPYTPLEPARGLSLTNGEFTGQPLAAGFDWHLDGASWLRSIQFLHELHLTFDGRQPENFLIAWQYVPVSPGRSYRLSFGSRAVDAANTGGIVWMLYDPENKPVVARSTSGGALIFTAPAEVLRLALRYERPTGSPRLEGTMAITQVHLELEP